ncbi:hypothetical protein HaLaN_14762 [Haematococcus lacustris]|uniref:Uncharacterized protein n=1 Tax=Haematococcus lacustris TaxID=44745 RepID=A0A699Z5X7_HAELA|nr:hypothetical protein HaLaN_14762 [Haematococcus lacustris]
MHVGAKCNAVQLNTILLNTILQLPPYYGALSFAGHCLHCMSIVTLPCYACGTLVRCDLHVAVQTCVNNMPTTSSQWRIGSAAWEGVWKVNMPSEVHHRQLGYPKVCGCIAVTMVGVAYVHRRLGCCRGSRLTSGWHSPCVAPATALALQSAVGAYASNGCFIYKVVSDSLLSNPLNCPSSPTLLATTS